MPVSVVIPIHNIRNRRYNRVHNCLLSLELQKEHIGKVIIINSSEQSQIEEIKNFINFPFVKHVVVKADTFNKPKLFQEALKYCDSEWVFLTDCDYIFSKDILQLAKLKRGNNILHKKVYNLPNLNTIGKNKIMKWNFNKKKIHEWGTLANGAMQYAKRSFFEEVIKDVPEYMQMNGWGAMDNIMTYIAYNKGLDILWMEEGEILHQYHRVEKFRRTEDHKRFNKNQEILHNYINKYSLPTLLSKDA